MTNPPGLNEVPPDAYKILSNQKLDTLYSFLTAYWQKKTDFIEWHEVRVVPVPKSNDLSEPKMEESDINGHGIQNL